MILQPRSGQCQRERCTNPASYRVGFRFYARPFTAPADAETAVLVCEEHKDVDVLEWFGTLEAWNPICQVFAAMGKAVPRRELTELKLTPLSTQTH